ncbi:MAG: CCA tRNA nucleotidyltransferase [Acidobacteriota bacterium]
MHNRDIEQAKAVVSKLVEAGYPAYLVGGVVRDMLMGRPSSDIDIATAAPPEVVGALFKKTVTVGKDFGVVRVMESGRTYEVSTFRREGPYRDGRRPAWISFASAQEDVTRRDFTVNGLLYDPVHDEVLDWVGGREDIERRVIRSIGAPEKRFTEDKLRMLRAVRFAANLDFQIAEATGEAIRKMASQIGIVSGERIRDELIKMLTGPHPDRGLLLLDETQLLPPLLPEIDAMKGVPQSERHHPEGDVFAHTVKILSFLKEPPVTLAFAALLHDVGKPPTYDPKGSPVFPNHARVGARMAREILDRLRFDRKTGERIAEAVANHLRFLDVRQMGTSTLRRFLSREHFEEELELHRVDALAGSGDLTNWQFATEKKQELEREPLPEPPLLGGNDLLALGFRPGPRLGRILKAVEEKRLEGSLRNRQEAEGWVKEHYPPED